MYVHCYYVLLIIPTPTGPIAPDNPGNPGKPLSPIKYIVT